MPGGSSGCPQPRSSGVSRTGCAKRPGRNRSFPAPVTSKGARTFAAPPATLEWSQLGDQARNDVIAAADKVAEGRWDFFGELRFDMVDPDWSLDPVSAKPTRATAQPFALTTVPQAIPATSSRYGSYRAPSPHRARCGMAPQRGGSLRRADRRVTAFVVAGQPRSHRRELG